MLPEENQSNSDTNNADDHNDPDNISDPELKITGIDKEFLVRISLNIDIPVKAISKREAIEKLQEAKFGIAVNRDNATVVEVKDIELPEDASEELQTP